jgi:serine protein kinase
MFDDFIGVIEKQREGKEKVEWEGTVLDYLYLVKENPEIATFAPGRIYNTIVKEGTDEVDGSFKIRGYEDLVSYNFFKDKIYGTYEPIHDIVKVLKASARRTETGKRILILVGPVGSGKSTILTLLKRGMELGKEPLYAIKDCPVHEEPLHLIPLEDRPYWEDKLGVRIEGTLCPMCQKMVDDNYTDENGVVSWDKIPVTRFYLSEQRRSGIGTFAPSDPKSQDVSELIGRPNMAKLSRYGETDPRAFDFSGELQVANRGLIELVEMLKLETKLTYVLISLAQEQVIKSPGFPQMYIDTMIIAHSNETEFDSFRSEKKNEAIHDRMYPVFVPWNLRVDDEIKIYEKMIRESDFRNIHIAPNTLRVAAQFAVLSRLKPSKRVSNLIEKMKVYNGEVSEEFKKSEIDVKTLRQEGREQGEGMSGISPRFIINALNVALGMKEDKNCINPIDVIRALRQNFDHHIGISDEDKATFLNLLMSDKDSVNSEYKEIAKKDVNAAFIYAYEEQAEALFRRYMENVAAFCKREKITDTVTGEMSDPDEKLMRSLEELIGVPVNSKTEFRNNIFVYKADKLEKGQVFRYEDYDPLRVAIEKKLMADLKNVVNLTISDPTSTDPKAKKRKEKALETLLAKGYCESCANVLLAYVSEILRKGG